LELLYSREERQYLETSSAFFWYNWNQFNMPPQLRDRKRVIFDVHCGDNILALKLYVLDP
jgi:hypothetical protein